MLVIAIVFFAVTFACWIHFFSASKNRFINLRMKYFCTMHEMYLIIFKVLSVEELLVSGQLLQLILVPFIKLLEIYFPSLLNRKIWKQAKEKKKKKPRDAIFRGLLCVLLKNDSS